MNENRSEFGEPWMNSEFGRYLGGAQWTLCGQTEPYQFKIVAEAKHEPIAERIKACVNFLAGVPTEVLNRIVEAKPSYQQKVAYEIACVALAIERGDVNGDTVTLKGAIE